MNTRLDHGQDWLELARQANWSVTRLAKLCNVSPRSLQRHFHEHFNKPPKVWLAEQRQKQALELLRDGSSVKETAANLRYNHSNQFSREFRKYWGSAPTAKPEILDRRWHLSRIVP